MTLPRSGVCAPWATPADMACPTYGVSSALVIDALAFASDALFFRCGRRWPGVCSATVRPCGRPLRWATQTGSASDIATGDLGSTAFGPFGQLDAWGACGCNQDERCGCGSLSAVRLGAVPVIAVSEVKVDGAVLDPARYRVDDHRDLVRLPDADGSNPGWPCCQRIDLPDTESGTWSVTLTYGGTPPPGGKEAAAALACEVLKAWRPELGECSLPSRAVSVTRQGVTVQLLNPNEVFDKGRTGIGVVDLFIATHNPDRNTRRARVWVPGSPSGPRRVGT